MIRTRTRLRQGRGVILEDMVGDNEDNMIEDNEEDKDFANEDGDEDKDVDLPVGTYGPLTTDP